MFPARPGAASGAAPSGARARPSAPPAFRAVCALATLPALLGGAAVARAQGVDAAAASPARTPSVRPLPVGFRSGFTIGPGLPARGTLVVESGASLVREDGLHGIQVGQLLLQVPLTARLGVRLGGTSYGWSRAAGAPAYSADGVHDVGAALVTRLRVPTGAGRVALSAVTGVTTDARPVAADARRTRADARLVASAPLPARVTLMASAGWAQAPVQRGADRWFGSAWAARPLRGPAGVFGEAFATTHEGRGGTTAAHLRTGLTWLVAPALHLDLSATTQVHGGARRTLGLGLTHRT